MEMKAPLSEADLWLLLVGWLRRTNTVRFESRNTLEKYNNGGKSNTTVEYTHCCGGPGRKSGAYLHVARVAIMPKSEMLGPATKRRPKSTKRATARFRLYRLKA